MGVDYTVTPAKKALRFKQQIYVTDYKGVTDNNNRRGRVVFTCDTIDEASEWLGKNQTEDDLDVCRYSIDGTPEAWHEQVGECGGSSICDCGDGPVMYLGTCIYCGNEVGNDDPTPPCSESSESCEYSL